MIDTPIEGGTDATDLPGPGAKRSGAEGRGGVTLDDDLPIRA